MKWIGWGNTVGFGKAKGGLGGDRSGSLGMGTGKGRAVDVLVACCVPETAGMPTRHGKRSAWWAAFVLVWFDLLAPSG